MEPKNTPKLNIDKSLDKLDLQIIQAMMEDAEVSYADLGKLFFVSDSMATINHGEPSFELYDEVVSESKGRIINSEGKLAGSSITQIDAIKNAYQKCNIPLESAISMATLYPAEYLGVSDYLGQIKKGYRADLVHFDSDFKIQNVWLAGNQIERRKS